MVRMCSYIMALFLFFISICNVSAQDGDGQAHPGEESRGATFKVSSRLVEIRAVVTDEKGRIVENLKREDFDLLESARPRETDFFSVTQVFDETNPPEEAKTDSKAQTALVNVRELLKKPSPRTAALFVDNLHLNFDKLNWVKASLRRFIDENLNPQDMVAIVTSDTNLGLAQQFTRDRQTLRYAIDQIKFGYIQKKSRFTPLLAARVEQDDRQALEEGASIIEVEEFFKDKFRTYTRARAKMVLWDTTRRRKATCNILKDLIKQMVAVPGQRIIVIFSEGFSSYQMGGENNEKDVQSVIDLALESGVVIYSIDAKGLETGMDLSLTTSPVDPNSSPLSGDPLGSGFSLDSTYYFASQNEIVGSLIDLANKTGGEMYRNTNNLSGSLARALDANRYYYNLGYYLNTGEDAPDARDIHVGIRNHPEYRVRIQRGRMPSDTEMNRVAEDENLSPKQRLLKAVNSPVPKADLGVSAQLYFIRNKTDDKQASLTVLLEGNDLQYKKEGERHIFNIEMVYIIYDSSGKQVEAFTTDIQGDLTPERLVQARNYGYWYSKRLALKPGVYQARVGIREKETGRVGTATAWVEVPDLKKTGLALSSLVLLDLAPTATEDSVDVSTGNLNRVRTLQGIRLYRQNEVCGYFFSLYHDGKNAEDSELALKMELLRGAEPVRQSDWRPLSIAKQDIDNKGWSYVGEKINLAGLIPGIYELRVSVKNKKQTVRQITALGIE